MKYQDLVEYNEWWNTGKVPRRLLKTFKRDAYFKDIKSLVKFMDLFEVKRGVVVTKDTFDKIKTGNKTVELIPSWRFLLTDKI